MKFSTFVLGLAAVSLAFTPAWAADANKKMAKSEQQVSMDQVPAPVKATIDKEAKGGATVGTVTQETDKKGKTYYEVQIDKGGKQRYVNISPEGKVLKRESAKKEAKETSTQK
jgi:hypothetical protein